jgi:hypothetical protein
VTRIGDEAVQALEFVYATVRADAGVQAAMDALVGAAVDLDAHLWPDPAPRDAPNPVIVYSATDPQDRRAIGEQARLNSRVPVVVKVVGETQDPSELAPVARALYAALHGQRGVPLSDGGEVTTCLRESGIAYPESSGGIHYRHLGHTFQVEIN